MPLFNCIYQLSPLRETKLHVSYYMITPQLELITAPIVSAKDSHSAMGSGLLQSLREKQVESYSPAGQNNPTSHSPLQRNGKGH